MRLFVLAPPVMVAAIRAVVCRPLVRFSGPSVSLLAACVAASLTGLHGAPAFAQAAAPVLEIEPVLAAASSVPRPAPRPKSDAVRGSDRKTAGTPEPRPTAAVERLVWDKAPLQIALGVGPERERSITFPAAMHIGVPQEIAPLLRVQTVGATSYLTALAPFARTRVVAEDRADGAVILLDLTASAETEASLPVSVVLPAAPAPNENDNPAGSPQVDMVSLTRFAAQQMYAPRRLTGARPGIRRVPVDRTPAPSLYAGAGLQATPAAQWRGGGLYVTAVVLQNLQARPVELDPQALRGRWRAITFQHGRLLAAGSEADTTVAYLVCEQAFEACR